MQGATSFIREAIRDEGGHQWCFAVFSTLRDQLDRFDVETDHRIEVFEEPPARYRSARRRLGQLEADFAPDCVLTPAGPAYIKFRAPHMLGFQLPWLTHATWSTYRAAMPLSQATWELANGAGSQFDPDCVAAFLTALGRQGHRRRHHHAHRGAITLVLPGWRMASQPAGDGDRASSYRLFPTLEPRCRRSPPTRRGRFANRTTQTTRPRL